MGLKKMTNNNSILFGNILKVFSANFIVVIVGFASTLIFPKIMSIPDYALYHTYTLYLSYITALHLGFPSGLVIKYAGKEYDYINKHEYKTEVLVTNVILCAFTILALVISSVIKSRMLFYIGLSIIPYDIIGIYKGLLQSWSLFKKYSIISGLISIFVPLFAVCYYLFKHNLPGNVYIIIYLAINWIVSLYIFSEIFSKIKGVKRGRILTRENWEIEKNGIALLVGNYINTLFVSADKQFIKCFFDDNCFAYYSFGMSMQAIMTVLITSISQPLFPSIAQGRFKDEDYRKMKELLIILGSLSGLAYFATAFIVNSFITKYTESLNVVGIYFVVFPAMAVINCLYINLYKVLNMMKTYIITLASVLAIAVILNIIAVKCYLDYTGVAIATTLTYYIWFIIGIKQFKFIKLSYKDIGYLLLYMIAFFGITRTLSVLWGVILYSVSIIILILVFYRNTARWVTTRVIKRNTKS